MRLERKIIEVEELQEEKPITFFTAIYDQQGNFKDVKIDYYEFSNTLERLGFTRFDVLGKKDTYFIKIEENVIWEVSINKITDTFIDSLETFDYTQYQPINAKILKSKFYRNIGRYFNINFLSRLRISYEISINSDTRTTAYFYFQNGFVECTEMGWQLKDYNVLKRNIWKNQILKRNFTFKEVQEEYVHKCGNFADFVFKVACQDLDRFVSLCSIIGYILHNYKEGKSKAIIFTDSTLSDVADGRTGKTLLCKAFGYIRNYCELNGKDFKAEDKHKYQQAGLDTQIIHLNDVKKNFDVDFLFNDITEGVKVERKSQDPFIIKVKIIISTNRTIFIEGASAKDRTLEFEFSPYFSDTRSPQDEYGQWFFSEDWDSKEWTLFDNFMMYCASVYLRHGIIKVKNINLNKRKALDHTCQEFCDFMDDLKIVPDERYDKRELYESFRMRYSDYNNPKFIQRNFTRWLRIYTQYSESLRSICKESDELRSNGSDYIIFRSRQ